MRLTLRGNHAVAAALDAYVHEQCGDVDRKRVIDACCWTAPEPYKISAGFTALEPHITFDNRGLFGRGVDSRKKARTWRKEQVTDGPTPCTLDLE